MNVGLPAVERAGVALKSKNMEARLLNGEGSWPADLVLLAVVIALENLGVYEFCFNGYTDITLTMAHGMEAGSMVRGDHEYENSPFRAYFCKEFQLGTGLLIKTSRIDSIFFIFSFSIFLMLSLRVMVSSHVHRTTSGSAASSR